MRVKGLILNTLRSSVGGELECGKSAGVMMEGLETGYRIRV